MVADGKGSRPLESGHSRVLDIKAPVSTETAADLAVCNLVVNLRCYTVDLVEWLKTFPTIGDRVRF